MCYAFELCSCGVRERGTLDVRFSPPAFKLVIPFLISKYISLHTNDDSDIDNSKSKRIKEVIVTKENGMKQDERSSISVSKDTRTRFMRYLRAYDIARYIIYTG